MLNYCNILLWNSMEVSCWYVFIVSSCDIDIALSFGNNVRIR
jgi:hypothetical protein